MIKILSPCRTLRNGTNSKVRAIYQPNKLSPPFLLAMFCLTQPYPYVQKGKYGRMQFNCHVLENKRKSFVSYPRQNGWVQRNSRAQLQKNFNKRRAELALDFVFEQNINWPIKTEVFRLLIKFYSISIFKLETLFSGRSNAEYYSDSLYTCKING